MIEVLVWGVCIFLMSSPFTYTLINWDPATPTLINISNMRQEGGSQWLLYAVRFGVLALALLAVVPRFRIVLRASRVLLPAAPFVIWAALSMLWADDFSTTMHSVVGLIAVLGVGYLMAIRLPPIQMARAVLWAGLVMGLSSLAYVVVLPAYGIHQNTDAMQSVHAGAWRGVYIHKNFLGQLAAFFAAATFWASPATLRPRVFKWALVAFLTVMLIKSTSASAVAILPISIALVWALVAGSATSRLVTMLLAVPGAIVAYISVGFILESLGRDATFTGRNIVWSIATDSFLERPIQGFGYTSLTYGDFSYQLLRRAGLIDPHSSYFDIALGLGFIGLALFLILIFFAWRAAIKVSLIGTKERQAALLLFSLVASWMVSGLTESAARPFAAEGGIGFFAVAALLSLSRQRRKARAAPSERPIVAEQAYDESGARILVDPA